MSAHHNFAIGDSHKESSVTRIVGGAVRALGAALARQAGAWLETRRRASEVNYLLEMDDRLLKDIGLNRTEVRFKLRLPPSRL